MCKLAIAAGALAAVWLAASSAQVSPTAVHHVANQPEELTLRDLAFMVGAWEAEEDGESMREVWDPARGDVMVGHFSIVQEGRAVLYELIAIEQAEDGPVMRLRHFGRGLTPWASEAAGPMTLPLVEAEGTRAVFEDPERDFPRQIIYAIDGDELKVELSPAAESDRDPIVLELKRAPRP